MKTLFCCLLTLTAFAASSYANPNGTVRYYDSSNRAGFDNGYVGKSVEGANGTVRYYNSSNRAGFDNGCIGISR